MHVSSIFHSHVTDHRMVIHMNISIFVGEILKNHQSPGQVLALLALVALVALPVPLEGSWKRKWPRLQRWPS